MKKKWLAILAALMISILLAGCAGATFTITSGGGNSTIEVNNAENGSTAESAPFPVGKGKLVHVESFLEEGELIIDFVEATIRRSGDESETVVVGDIVASVTVGSGDGSEFSLEKGEYVMLLTAVGSTNGKVKVSIR